MNAGTPDISVVIPYLNQPEHLGNCLSSLASQAFDLDRIEIIVVDNGSKSLPTTICAPYANVRLVEEKTPGPGPARNKGISASSAQLLAFIDADCLAGNGWLQAILDAFEEKQTQILGGDVRIALANPEGMTMLEAYESIYSYRQKDYIEKKGFSGTGNLAMRRSCYEQVGPFAGIGIAEDRDWGQRAMALGYRIEYAPQMIVFHPARKTVADLETKWDRHIAHDYAEQANGVSGRVQWLIKALVLPVSPLWEAVSILRTDRVNTARERFLAWWVLVLIRLHRSRKAFGVMFNNPSAARSQDWNRS